MNIQVRDVIANKHHVFKDTGKNDAKFARDCLVILASNGDYVYYLTLATHNNNVMNNMIKYPDSNYLLKKKNCVGLKSTSLVNLQLIYKEKLDGKLVVIVPEYEYKEIIKKFMKWQDLNPDELYNEVKPLLEKS